jgi:cell division transport system permease protein
MIFRDLIFFVSEAFISIRRSGFMTFVAVATITVSLIVFGIFLLVSLNINHVAAFLSSKLEIRVYLKNNLSAPEIASFQERLKATPGVREVRFVDRQEAWTAFKQNYPNLSLDDMIQENPLPDSFRILLNSSQDSARVVSYAGSFKDYVEDVVYGGVVAERIEKFATFLRLSGLSLVILLAVATLMIVVNTIRLTVMARHEEITIMRLVGATNSFIKGPFVFEGLFMGILGSAVSVTVLKISYSVFSYKFQQNMPYFPIVYDRYPLALIYLGVGLLGAFLGVLGAYVSVTRSLRISNKN